MKRYGRKLRWWYWRHFRPAKYKVENQRFWDHLMSPYKTIVISDIFDEHPLIAALNKKNGSKHV